MTAPTPTPQLTTRDALTPVLAAHQYDTSNGWACTCGEDFADRMDFSRPALNRVGGQFFALLVAHQADALLASGALIDAASLAEDEALVLGIAEEWQGDEPTRAEIAELRTILYTLAAALTARAEEPDTEAAVPG